MTEKLIKPTHKRDRSDLLALGFKHIAAWGPADPWLDYVIPNEQLQKAMALLSVGSALYAFCIGPEVVYLGKTSQSLKKRFRGYCKPANTQSTNKKCHAAIKAALSANKTVDILAFASADNQAFRGFEINLAAGLEDILIRSFAPAWNGGAKGVILTESALREAEQMVEDTEPPTLTDTEEIEGAIAIGCFAITLGATYYTKGIINPGLEASDLLGADGELLTIRFSDGTPAVVTRIDRRANRNGSVRFVGSNQAISAWFQTHFSPGEVVAAKVLDANLVKLLAKPVAAPEE